MESRLADTLERLAAPFLTPLLLPQELPGLLHTIRRLPDICWAGLEFRLGEDQWQVDISQRVTALHNEPAILLEHARSVWQQDKAFAGAAGQRLLRFLTTWVETSLHQRAPVFWLEFDGHSPAGLPAMFFTPQASHLAPHQQQVPPAEARAAAGEVLSLLLEAEQLAALEPGLDRAFANCPGDSFVCQIGVMLSRETQALRICVEGLTSDQFVPCLEQNAYRGPLSEVETLVQSLTSGGGQINMLNFDIGAGTHETVSLEVGFEGLPDEQDRWIAFLEQLVRSGLCTPAKRDALLAWHGTLQLEPEGTGDEPWLTQFVKLRIGHVKLTHRPGEPCSAKAYPWFGATW